MEGGMGVQLRYVVYMWEGEWVYAFVGVHLHACVHAYVRVCVCVWCIIEWTQWWTTVRKITESGL